MTKAITIGIDIAKNVFHLHGAAPDGAVVFQRKLSRGRLLDFLAGQAPCLVAMEACSGAHHWGREIGRLGHDVQLIPPQYVKPFVKRQKNDAADAQAIAEAAARASMRFVAVKSAEQQAQAMVLNVRDLLQGQRVQTINALRGHLAEHGIVAPQGPSNVVKLEAAPDDAGLALFPATRIEPRSNRADEMRTTRGGGRKAVSLGGAVTGFGADVIIIDDLMKALDALSERKREEAREYFEQTLYSRLDDKKRGRIIAIQQRLHEDDFAGYLIDKGSFDHLNLPSIADIAQKLPLYAGRVYTRRIKDLLSPEREPMKTLDTIRAEIGSYAFSAQYLQNPVPEDSCHLRLDRMTLIDDAPERSEILEVVQSWDTAIKDTPNCDYSVCTTWGWRDRWYLLDVFRLRLDFPALKAAALALKYRWRADLVLVEDTSNGTALVDQLRREGHAGFWPKAVTGSKFERFVTQTDILQSDKVAFPTKAPWFQDLKKELFVFPNGRHDDQVDSVTQFLHWVQTRWGGYVERDPVTGRPLGRPRPQGRPFRR